MNVQSNLELRPPLVRDHLSSATSFPEYQKFPSQICIIILNLLEATTSHKWPSSFLGQKDWNFPLLLTSH